MTSLSDLATVLWDARSFAERPQYCTSLQVKADVALVWSNCLLYNSRPIDQPTRDLCADVQRHFENGWSEAGLDQVAAPISVTISPPAAIAAVEVGEADVPAQYNVLRGKDLPYHAPPYSCLTPKLTG